MLKLFGHPMSTCTRKVLTVLAEKNAPHEFILVDLMKGEHKQPAHLARQPFGVVPAIEDGELSLFESRAIIRYLDAKLPGVSLTPSNIVERARMDQWMLVEQCYFSSASLKISMQKLMSPNPDAEIMKAGRVGVVTALDQADQWLAKNSYFAGTSFSLADISWMPYVEYLFAAEAGDLITSREHVKGWWDRVSPRASWQKVSGRAK